MGVFAQQHSLKMSALWVVSKKSLDFLPWGIYLQRRLSLVSGDILSHFGSKERDLFAMKMGSTRLQSIEWMGGDAVAESVIVLHAHVACRSKLALEILR